MNVKALSRRTVLGAGGIVLLGASAGCITNSQSLSRDPAVAETREGSYRGRALDGVYVFKGMRYGASTAGTGRFMPPRPAATFVGVRDAFEYADQAPQARGALAAPGAMSEDCLRINVWTPEPKRGGKRPVLLWFHGGGFEAGSGSSLLYDGANMARRGDVVICTINHRLNVFGFCDLSGILGADFAQSGNVGYLDLVAAMTWVKSNVDAFGGDPDNVMIYGQSGGGRKVSVCFAGKDAKCLFAKGVVQSGSHLLVQTPEQSMALSVALLKALDIDLKKGRDLQLVPQDRLTEAQRSVIAKVGYRFEPTLNGINFDTHPFIPNAPKWSAKVPMMVGTTRTELSNQLGRDPDIYSIDDAALKLRLEAFYPPTDIDEAVSVFKASNPGASATELYFKMSSWRSYIRNATLMVERRAELNVADNPTWMYQVTWKSPAEGGRRLSQHTLDLPFMFDNVARAENLTGPQSEETRTMTESMASAWIAFARKGDPNHGGIPRWPTYDLQKRSVMLFDAPPVVVDDPFRSERVYMDRYQPVRATARSE
jgi:para-nitrobenzyl esterase